MKKLTDPEKRWVTVNQTNTGMVDHPNLLMVQRYREQGEEAVLAISCPPDRDIEVWERQKNQFLKMKREEPK